MNDAELIHAYLAGKSQAAFAEIVSRYVDMVYAAAFRQMCDRQLAEDAVQGVFLALAEKLPSLSPHTPLGPWLYAAARYACINMLRTRARQKRTEIEARKMFLNAQDPNAAPHLGEEGEWLAVAPILDEAMAQLGDTDRSVIVMRFFERRQLKDIAAQIGTGESGAEKRIARALEKLRRIFVRRGAVAATVATTFTLGAMLSTHSVHAAPNGVAASVVAALAAAKTGLHVTAGQVVAKGLLKTMFIAKTTQWAAVAAMFLLMGAAGTLLFERLAFSHPDTGAESAALTQRVEYLEERLAEAERTKAQAPLANPLVAPAPLAGGNNGVTAGVADPAAAPAIAGFDHQTHRAIDCNACHKEAVAPIAGHGLVAPADIKPLDARLMLHLPFAGDLLDHSANKVDVKVVGNVCALSHKAGFDGASWLELPLIRLDQREFAVSLWIKPSAVSATGYGLVTQNTQNIQSQLLHLILGYNMEPHLSFYENHLASPPQYALPANAWTHLVFQYFDKKQHIYMNGKLIAERWAGPYEGMAGPTLIGRPPQWFDHPVANFTGWMSDLRIYDGRLNQAHILALGQLQPDKGAPQIPVPAPERADAF